MVHERDSALGLYHDYTHGDWRVFMFGSSSEVTEEDGKSMMDWEDEYIDKTRHLWTDETMELLNALVMPVPSAFRDVARRKIAGRIGQFALEERATEMTSELVVKGYISATPKRDHKFLKKALTEHAIDWRDYALYFQN